jgi:hypothetical protein
MQPMFETCSICQKSTTESSGGDTMLYEVFEIYDTLSNGCIQAFPHVYCNPVNTFFCDAGNAQPNILFWFFKYVQAIFINILFQEPPVIEIQCC